ncbi:MAG: DUF302 domain-containing protein [Halodesulfurarchaeum sp.]
MSSPADRAGDGPLPTVSETSSFTVREDFDGTFEDLVLEVQLEHELGGFETVATTRIDELVAGALDEEVTRTAMVLVCHAEIARDAVEISPLAAGLFPCTTLVYEDEEVGHWHVYHASATKATRDLGFFPEAADAVDDLVTTTEERMDAVWDELERRLAMDAGTQDEHR